MPDERTTQAPPGPVNVWFHGSDRSIGKILMPLMLKAARLLFVPVLLASATSATSLCAQVTMPLADVLPGMKGTGRTVFKGAQIETFDFEVLGVQRNISPGHSLILVKASGGPLAETGILAGMSGSPCYVDGKLIGALSIGFPFEKEPMGGITPIGEMLDQLRDLPETAPSRTPLILPKLEPPKVLKAALRGEMLSLADLMGERGQAGQSGQAASELPLVISGTPLLPETQALFSGLPMRFANAGNGAMVSSVSPAPDSKASPIEPGGMASISLVQGDMNMAAAGTITYVSGNKVLLFGHQLFNLGSVDLPLWSASVAGSVASYQSSFKLAQPVAPIGALRLDRSVGVGGVLGAEPRMVPLRIGLNLGGRKTLNFRFEMMDHPFITPILTAAAVSQTLNGYVRGLGLQSLSMQGNIKIAGHPAIEIENVIADLNPNRLASFVGAMVQALAMNPFERPVFEGISLTIKAEERLDLTMISAVRILKAHVKRGESLPVLVTLQNIQGVRENATLNIPVPHSAQIGKATLLVGDGLSLAAADPDERVIDVSGLNDVVRLLNGALRNNHAYALLVQSQPGAGLRGSRIEGIPPSVASLIASDGGSSDNKLQRHIIGRALLPLEREVRGLITLEVEID